MPNARSRCAGRCGRVGRGGDKETRGACGSCGGGQRAARTGQGQQRCAAHQCVSLRDLGLPLGPERLRCCDRRVVRVGEAPQRVQTRRRTSSDAVRPSGKPAGALGHASRVLTELAGRAAGWEGGERARFPFVEADLVPGSRPAALHLSGYTCSASSERTPLSHGPRPLRGPLCLPRVGNPMQLSPAPQSRIAQYDHTRYASSRTPNTSLSHPTQATQHTIRGPTLPIGHSSATNEGGKAARHLAPVAASPACQSRFSSERGDTTPQCLLN